MSCKEEVMDDSSVMYPSSASALHLCPHEVEGPACAMQPLQSANLLWAGIDGACAVMQGCM